jgi:hypothetical protein
MLDTGAIATGVATSIATQKASEALGNITKSGPDPQESILQALLDIKNALAPQEKRNFDFPMSLQPYPYEYQVDEAWMGKAHLCIFFFNATPLRFDVEGLGSYELTIGSGWVQCDVRGRISTTDETNHNVIISYRDDAIGSELVGVGSGPSGSVTVTNFPTTQNVDVTSALPAGTNQIGHVIVDSGGGGGVQYTDGQAPPTNPIAGALVFDNGGTWDDVGSDHPLPVSGTVGVSSLPSIPAGANAIGSVSVSNLPAKQAISSSVGPGAIAPYASNPAAFTANTDLTFAWGTSGTTQVNHVLIQNNSPIPTSFDFDEVTTLGSLSVAVGQTLLLDVSCTALHMQQNGTSPINGTAASNVVVKAWA